MELVIEIAGWIAAGVLLGAYGLLSKGRVSGRGRSFQSLNVVGSLLVGLNSLAHEAWPSVTVNVVWLAIGVATLAASRRSAADAATTDAATTDAATTDAATTDAATADAGTGQRTTPDRAPSAAIEEPTRTEMPAAVVGSAEGATAGRAVQPTLV